MTEPLADPVLDGIQQYDNPAPGWWVGLFWTTAVFCVPYFLYYHLAPGPTRIDEYNIAAAAAFQNQSLAVCFPRS